ncbi:MAG TPA: polysaccharide deacetylase family protein [Candidatus Omnitrophota bacterium]|nr:polysaccharide deacetylase family protein [Candidatus Omnitrophota bacterium]
MTSRTWVLAGLIFGIMQAAQPGFAEELQPAAEPEDYRLLKEIITAEFAGQAPHEWGESVSGVKERLKTDDKVLAIGVDACDLMGKGEDAKLIKFLEAEGIPATIFLCGEWVDKNSAVLRKLAANPLFEIANQGLRRKACSVSGKTAGSISGTQDIEELFAEVEKNARKIEAVTGILPQYYHAGAGYYDEVAVRIIKALGYEPLGSGIRWPRDQGLDRKQVLNAMINPASGAIAILGGPSLQSSFVEGAIESIRRLRSKGYKFVKISDYPLE